MLHLYALVFRRNTLDSHTVRAPFTVLKQAPLAGKKSKWEQITVWESNFSRVMFVNMSLQAKEIPGIKIFRSSATIYYTNAEMYLEALQEKVCVITKYISFALSKIILIAFLSCLLFHISSLFLMMPDFLHRVVSISGSCWRRRRRGIQNLSVNRRKRKDKLKKRPKKLKRRQRNK